MGGTKNEIPAGVRLGHSRHPAAAYMFEFVHILYKPGAKPSATDNTEKLCWLQGSCDLQQLKVCLTEPETLSKEVQEKTLHLEYSLLGEVWECVFVLLVVLGFFNKQQWKT